MAELAVVLRRAGRIVEIVLNLPDKLKVMNLVWMRDLVAAVEAVAADPPDVVVVRGAGRAFCAGLDLDMMAEEGMPPELYPLQERAFSGLEALDRIVSDDAVLGLPAARATKRLTRSAFDEDFATAFERSQAVVLECLQSPEATAARAAWAARRN
jgi:enoyl-CoA hydratase/carnithine racemase